MDSTKRSIAYQSTYQILKLILPFVTAPYISRVLGADQVGISSYTLSIVNYFTMIAMLGIEFYGNRMIARVRDDPQTLSRTFTEIFYSHLIPSAAAIIAYLIFCTQMSELYRLICLVQVLYVVADALNINWLFEGLGKFKITVTRNIIIKILTILAIFIFVRRADDLIIYIIIMAVGTLFSQSAVWVVFRKHTSFARVQLRNVLSHIMPMTVLFVSVIATNIYRMIGKTMLGNMGALEALGCYEYADKIVRMPLGIILAIGTVMLSKTSNMLAKGKDDKAVRLMKDTLRYITVFSVPIVFGLMAVGPDFSVLFFGAEYQYTGSIIGALAISLLFMAWITVLRTQYFMPANKDRSYVISVWAGAMINIVLNLLLIPHYSAIGAALASDAAYLFVLATQLFFARKDVCIVQLMKSSVFPLLSGLIMFISVRGLRTLLSCNWLSLGLQAMAGVFVFVVLILLYWIKTRDPLLVRLYPKLGISAKL